MSDANGRDIDLIEEQHRRLVGLVESIESLSQASASLSDAISLLEALSDEAQVHFRTEEELMLQRSYKDYEGHKYEHDFLLAKLLELKHQVGRGDHKVTANTVRYLRDWLNEHIARTDVRMENFLASSSH